MAEDETTQSDGVGLGVGTRIGKYEIRRRIAIGGQGVIYQAFDTSAGRIVALKQISPALAESPEFVERFRAEARILGELGRRQASVVKIYELLEDPRGLFIVSEFVEGTTVEQMLIDSPGGIDPALVLQIIWQLAGVLRDIHAAGIIHRDIKPSNIIITDQMRPKIADFGVASTASGQTSMLLGTTKYMAPEIFAGGALDGRSDIYSLGMVAYEMLLGRERFNEVFADIVRDKHTEPMRWMKWHGDPQAVAPPADTVRPDVPPGLARLVADMLQKSPDDRPADAEALGRAMKTGATASAQAQLIPAPRTSGEEAEHPSPQVEELPTAPLPRKPVSLQTKLLVAALLAATVMVAAGTLAYVYHSSRQTLAQRADAAYDRGETQYIAGNYAEALDEFRSLADAKFNRMPQAAKASVRAAMCRAHLAVIEASSAEAKDIADSLWREASTAEDEARRLNQDLHARATTDEMIAWAARVNRAIERFRDHRLDTWTFADRMMRAKAFFAEGDFRRALDELNALGESGAKLSDRQAGDLAALDRQIRVVELKTGFEDLLREGDSLLDQLLPDDAAEKYDSGARILASDAAKQLLSEDELESYGRDIEAKLDRLRKIRQHVEAISKADEAQAAGDNAGQLQWLLTACEMNSTPAVEQRIRDLRFDMGLVEARRLQAQWADEKTGQLFVEARQAYQEVLAIRQDATVAAELEALEAAGRRWALVQAADAATQDGEFEKALGLYSRAQKLADDQDIQDKLLICRYRQQLAVGDALRDGKRYAQAAEAYEAARQMNPAGAEEVDTRIKVLQLMAECDKTIAEGDVHLAAQQFTRSLNFYRSARDRIEAARSEGLLDEQLHQRLIGQAAERIRRAQYEKFIFYGREAMEREDYNGARANFNQAKEYDDTEEVRKLLEQVGGEAR